MIGNICALLTAVTWAGALVFFKQAGRHYTPVGLNLYKNVVGLLLLVLTLLAMGQHLDSLGRFDAADIWMLLVSGFIGIALGDTLLFVSLDLIGVGLVGIVECLFTPFVLLFSFAIIGERISLIEYVGAITVLTGVLVSSKHQPAAGRTRKQLAGGMMLGALAIGLTAFGIVLAKPVLEVHDFPLIWAAAIRLVAGTVPLMLMALASQRRKEHWSAMRPSSAWRYSLPGSILGSFLANVLWIAGFKFTKASVAAVLNQTTVVFAIVFAAMFLKEALGTRKIVAMALALIGVLLVTMDSAV